MNKSDFCSVPLYVAAILEEEDVARIVLPVWLTAAELTRRINSVQEEKKLDQPPCTWFIHVGQRLFNMPRNIWGSEEEKQLCQNRFNAYVECRRKELNNLVRNIIVGIQTSPKVTVENVTPFELAHLKLAALRIIPKTMRPPRSDVDLHGWPALLKIWQLVSLKDGEVEQIRQ